MVRAGGRSSERVSEREGMNGMDWGKGNGIAGSEKKGELENPKYVERCWSALKTNPTNLIILFILDKID